MATKKATATKSTPAKRAGKAKQAPSPKGRATGRKKTAEKPNAPAGETEVTLDRRRENAPVPMERRTKVQRRRQIDPTTCERDYSNEEVEFMNAMDEYKRTSGRMFPTCSEVLEVIRNLGYVKLSPAEQAQILPTEDVELPSQEEASAEPASEADSE